MQYADEKTKVVRDVVNIAGEAIAITAFEVVNGDPICYTMSNRLLERERCRIRETPSN